MNDENLNEENKQTEPNEQKPVEQTEPVSEPINTPVSEQLNNDQAEGNEEPKNINQPISEETTETNQQQPQTPPQQPPVANGGFNQQFYGEQKHYVPNGFGQPNFNNQTPPAFDQNGGQPPKKPNNSKTGLKIFAIILAIAIVFTIGVGVGYLADDNKTASTESSEDGLKYKGENVEIQQGVKVERDGISPDSEGKYSADEVSEIVGQSVVNIQVYSETDKQAGAIASGVILDKSGYIISNDHIYSEVANAKFVITTSDGKSYKAKYIAGDQRSDISILKFIDMPDTITPAVFANSSEMKSGDEVIAIGSPYGLSGTVTKGIISSPSRRISFSQTSTEGSSVSYSMRVIQTDTALNSGNSGGALVNMYGQVVGISSSKIVLSGYEGLCFAIPANDAVKYTKSLIKNGKVVGRAKLGITYSEVNGASSLVNNIPAGLKIQSIDSESELSKQNLNKGTSGDIITEMNGEEITSSDIALDLIDNSSAGDTLKLKIYNSKTKKYKTYSVKLLEDTSVSSYTTKIPTATQQPTTNGKYYYYGDNGNGNQNGNGNNESGNGSGSDDFSEFFGNGNW